MKIKILKSREKHMFADDYELSFAVATGLRKTEVVKISGVTAYTPDGKRVEFTSAMQEITTRNTIRYTRHNGGIVYGSWFELRDLLKMIREEHILNKLMALYPSYAYAIDGVAWYSGGVWCHRILIRPSLFDRDKYICSCLRAITIIGDKFSYWMPENLIPTDGK